MRLVTYDRGGARRLGAWVGEAVVDLPDAVGHPAFPTTMESLVPRGGGSLLDAARDALDRPDYWEHCVVPHARLLVPLLPWNDGGGTDVAVASRPPPSDVPWLIGPTDRVPWPAAGSLDYELELACIVGREAGDVPVEDAHRHVFGYTLVVGWRRVAASPGGEDDAFAGASLGPCVVTADEFDPAASTLTFSVNGRVRSRGGFDHATWSFPDLVSHLSRQATLRPGEVLGSGTFPGGRGADVGVRLRPGAVVGAGATGIGTFVVTLGAPGERAADGARPGADPDAAARPPLRLLRAAPDVVVPAS
jgi:Fumarylacetoacetate (FAA) hydrolase family